MRLLGKYWLSNDKDISSGRKVALGKSAHISGTGGSYKSKNPWNKCFDTVFTKFLKFKAAKQENSTFSHWVWISFFVLWKFCHLRAGRGSWAKWACLPAQKMSGSEVQEQLELTEEEGWSKASKHVHCHLQELAHIRSQQGLEHREFCGHMTVFSTQKGQGKKWGGELQPGFERDLWDQLTKYNVWT